MDPRPVDTQPSEKVAVETGHTGVAHGMPAAATYDAHGQDEHTAAVYDTHDTHTAAIYDAHGHDAHHAHEPHEPHESPWQMILPLVVLAVFALLGGFVNAGPLGIHWLSHFLHQEAAEFNWTTAGIATALALAGIGLGVALYRNAFQRSTDADPLESMMPGIFRVLNNKFGVDELYAATVGRLNDQLGWVFWAVDRLVDGVVNGVGLLSLLWAKINFIIDDFVLNQGADTLAEVTTYTGDGLRQTTTGKIQDYGALIFMGVLIIGIIYLFAF
jgi:NADH-quinone oxidoreductase subunit L